MLSFERRPFFLLVGLLLLPGAFAQRSPAAPPDRIAGRLDPNRVAAIKGNIHPKARPENDRGRVSASLSLDYVTLRLKPAPAQQADLDQLLTQMQDPRSPNFRKWLTPEQYADRFGASPADLAPISAWLEGQGLTVISTARGRNFVVFKGSAGAVEAALHVEIHNFLVDGRMHYANATEPSVPAAMQSFTAGFLGLDDFKLQAPQQATQPIPESLYQNQHVMAPIDLWTIFDTVPFYKAGYTGAGMKLAVIGQSDVNLSDITQYRTAINIPPNTPVKLLVPGSKNPGILSGDSGESDLDLEMAGAIDYGAEIVFVYSPSVITSVTYAIDQAVAPVISYSYAGCELNDSRSAAMALQQLAQQASAEGITWVAASGDNGAAGCDAGLAVAASGISVMLPASIPEVTGVGGTAFADGSGNYWSNSNGVALSYIPEAGWNDTAQVNHLAASGGGMSIFFPRPSWQSAPGVPSGSTRLVPDVALSASAIHDSYFVVEAGSNRLVGGTSAATPVFAGMILLINQFLGLNGAGNINSFLYGLASTPGSVCSTYSVTATCAFHDVTLGSNMVPCTSGLNGCFSGQMGYFAGAGYDMVTGLGSVDATNLALAAARSEGPSISSVTTAYGGTAIAQNTFIVIKGGNLVPTTTPASGAIWSSAPSFASGLMPTQLNGVSVTVNGKAAFVYFYCSAATDPSCSQDQLNILTPLDNTVGPVPVVVTSGGASSPAFSVSLQTVSPSFLLFSAGYIAATHGDNSLVGAASLYPGYSTPAKHGEIVALYAVGFGLPSTALINGSATQSGSLPVLPSCSVGGSSAPVAFAGLISPGLYQLNLTIPAGAPNGDDSVVCIYGGTTTPPTDVVTVLQ
ncbi:MAG TPA: protease pro-enzyme activation domain-containing protein [Bryobacteraceae bacterium]|jgi:uncharacterized protein (TIGR03437 family)